MNGLWCKTDIYPSIGTGINDFIIVSDFFKQQDRHYVKCLCQKCGNYVDLNAYNLCINGAPQNCGCQHPNYIHGHSKGYSNHKSSPEYVAWASTKTLCYNPNHQRYPQYGGRGIIVCSEWKYNFQQFICDVGIRPSKEYVFGRININEEYNKENCRWMTKKEKGYYNRRIYLKYNNESKLLIEWAKDFNIDDKLLQRRIKDGWDINRALIEPPNYDTKKKIVFNGIEKNIFEWAKEFSIDVKVIHSRLYKGWDVGKALTTPGKNESDLIHLEYNGKNKTIREWSEELNIKYGTLKSRFYSGWSVEKILTTPVKSNAG